MAALCILHPFGTLTVHVLSYLHYLSARYHTHMDSRGSTSVHDGKSHMPSMMALLSPFLLWAMFIVYIMQNRKFYTVHGELSGVPSSGILRWHSMWTILFTVQTVVYTNTWLKSKHISCFKDIPATNRPQPVEWHNHKGGLGICLEIWSLQHLCT